MTKRKTNDENIADFIKAHGDKYDYSKFNTTNVKEKGTVICHKIGKDGKEHGIFIVSANNHKNGKGCPECKKEILSIKKRMSLTTFIEKAKLKHGNNYDYSLVNINGNNETKITIKCNKCGCIFEQRINNHLNGKGCPNCKFSKLEKETKKLLEQHNISFDCQKTFEWLLSQKNCKMSLDFYLPKYNIAIECQGIQHYEAKGMVFNEEKVNTIKQRDRLKYQLCQEHNIPIYYIKYNEKVDERLNEILEKINVL